VAKTVRTQRRHAGSIAGSVDYDLDGGRRQWPVRREDAQKQCGLPVPRSAVLDVAGQGIPDVDRQR
jgi:hypothetical protein